MSLAAIKSQIIALGKRLDVMSGRGQQVEYVWSAIDDYGEKIVYAGDIHSMADDVIEIQAGAEPGTAPKILINGVERLVDSQAPTLEVKDFI